MGVKTYQAYTMAEALVAAKGDLGADAVILETRSFRRGGVLGVRRKTIFELTATSGDRADLSTTAVPRRVTDRAVREYARVNPISTTRESSPPDLTRTRRLAQALADDHVRHLTSLLKMGTAPAVVRAAQ